MWDGSKLQICSQCSKQFPYYTPEPPKLCPRCSDIAQKRPTICIARNTLHKYYGIKIVSLPKKWVEKQTGEKNDYPSYYICMKGRRYGARWSGRIDIYASRPFEVGDIINIREMQVVHLTKKLFVTKHFFRGGGSYTIEKPVPYFDAPEEAVEQKEKREYLVFEKSREPEIARLVWAEAHTKTTLKGLGRQCWASVEGAPLVSWEISGCMRSGRKQTTGVLAIVDEEHPLIIKKTGGIKGEEVYK